MSGYEMLWNWTNYKVLAIKEDLFPVEHMLNMLADLHERVLKIEKFISIREEVKDETKNN